MNECFANLANKNLETFQQDVLSYINNEAITIEAKETTTNNDAFETTTHKSKDLNTGIIYPHISNS